MTMNLAPRTGESIPKSEYGSDRVTHGIRVHVAPIFMPEHSSRPDRKFVFAYRIRITNEGSRRVRLASRRWTIVDAFGRAEEVAGEGVVGQQPVLDPGESFEYASHALLKTEWGTMEGAYRMQPEGGEPFEVAIGRFYLVAQAGQPVAAHPAG